MQRLLPIFPWGKLLGKTALSEFLSFGVLCIGVHQLNILFALDLPREGWDLSGHGHDQFVIVSRYDVW